MEKFLIEDLENKLNDFKEEIIAKFCGLQIGMFKSHDVIIDQLFDLKKKMIDFEKTVTKISKKVSVLQEQQKKYVILSNGIRSVETRDKKIVELINKLIDSVTSSEYDENEIEKNIEQLVKLQENK